MTSRHDTPQPEPHSSPSHEQDNENSLSSLWWNTNVPAQLQTSECPFYLVYAFNNAKDRAILSTPDHLYHRQTWQDVQKLIHENRLEDFTRVPSELRAYRRFCEDVTREYGSILNFILKARLGWELGSSESINGETSFEDPSQYLVPSSSQAYFANTLHPASYRILLNDWPYGFDPRIKHLVVWTKFVLPLDPDSEVGDMSPATKRIINDFVEETFAEVREKLWFKNWGALKSVHAVEHFHVLLFDPDEDFVRRVTSTGS